MRATLAFLVAVTILGALAWIVYAAGLMRVPETSDGLISLLGLFISAFSFLLAAYFSVIAVTAYGHIRDIEQKALEAKRLHADAEREFAALRATIEEAKGQGGTFLRYLAESGSVISEFMQAVDEQSGARVKDLHLAIKRYMFSVAASNPGDRLDAARELVELGEKSDLETVEPFLVMSTSPDARGLLKVLRAKLHAFDIAHRTAA